MRDGLSDKYKRNRIETATIIGLAFVLVIGVFMLWSSEDFGLHNFFLVLCFVVVCVCLYCIWDNPYTKAMKEYNLTEERLDAEFQCAEEVYKNQLYVSDNYIIHTLYAGMNVFKVEDVVWMYKEYIRDHKYLYRKEFYIVIYTKDRKKNLMFCPYPCHDERKVDDILNYFSQRFSHILIGYSKEAKRMFKHEFERFLQVKYRYGIKKRVYEREPEKQV